MSSDDLSTTDQFVLSPLLSYAILDALVKHKKQHSKLLRRSSNGYVLTDVTKVEVEQKCRRFLYEKRTAITVQKTFQKELYKDSKSDQPWNIWNFNIPISRNLSSTRIKIPNSTSQYVCSGCSGYGYKECSFCRGQTVYHCDYCYNESSFPDMYRCGECCGRRFIRCYSCDGYGKEPCKKCCETGRVVRFDAILAEWYTTQKYQFIGAPKYLHQFLIECNEVIQPNNQQNLSSSQFQSSPCSECRVRKQDVTTTRIPLYYVTYKHHQKEKFVWIEGDIENLRVFDPKRK